MTLSRQDRERAAGFVLEFYQACARFAEQPGESLRSQFEAAKGIWALLKPQLPFEDTYEIRQFLLERLHQLGEKFDPDKHCQALVDELLGPYPSWRFDVIVGALPIFRRTHRSPTVLGHGRDVIRITTTKENLNAAMLTGSVTAPT